MHGLGRSCTRGGYFGCGEKTTQSVGDRVERSERIQVGADFRGCSPTERVRNELGKPLRSWAYGVICQVRRNDDKPEGLTETLSGMGAAHIDELVTLRVRSELDAVDVLPEARQVCFFAKLAEGAAVVLGVVARVNTAAKSVVLRFLLRGVAADSREKLPLAWSVGSRRVMSSEPYLSSVGDISEAVGFKLRVISENTAAAAASAGIAAERRLLKCSEASSSGEKNDESSNRSRVPRGVGSDRT